MKNKHLQSGLLLIAILFIGFALTTCKKDPKDSETKPIPETTKVIDESAWQDNVISVDSSNFTFTFNGNLSNQVILKKGDILVSSEGEGYLRKVTNVVKENGEIKVYTEFASINEAVRDGNFTLNTVLSEQKISKITYLKNGIKIDTSHMKSTKATNISATINEYLDPDQKVHITGNFSILSAINCELVITQFRVEKFSIDYEIEELINLQSTLEILNILYEKEVELVNITFNPITIMIGPVPVRIVPEMVILVGAEMNIESNVTTSINQQMSYAVGMLYENETWAPTQEQTKSFTFEPPTLSATASAKAYIKPQLNIKVYGTVAPYLYGEAYGRIDADLLANPWWVIYGGANVGAGVKMEIFGQELFDWPTTPFYLFEYEEPVINSSEVETNQAPPLPSSPLPENGAIDIPTSSNLSWQCVDPDADPLTFDIYLSTSNPPFLWQNNISEFSLSTGVLQENTMYYWKIVAKDNHNNATTGTVWQFKTMNSIENEAPAIPSNPNPQQGAIAVALPVTLQWTCTDPENDPILYDVYFGANINPPLAQTALNTTSFQTTGLLNGTQYYWRIVAKDNHQNATESNLWTFGTETNITTPTVTTSAISEETQSTATGGGNITSDGGASVTARGVCYSTNTNPDLTDLFTSNGTGTGSFTSNLTGLNPNTTYYVRAYATNSVGTAFGVQKSFTTLSGGGQLPTVTTTTITNPTQSTATGGGNVTSDGGASITARGVCYSTTTNPDLTDLYTINGSGTGSFISSITDLSPSTTYYVRAYATNSVGAAYGENISFITTEWNSTFEMIFIEGGTFEMGCTAEQGGACESSESPVHTVTLSSYSIMQTEVTQQMWLDVMGNNPSDNNDCPYCPVEQVSWNDVQQFIININQQTGLSYRLPTEAEWEFAARGGNQSQHLLYSGSFVINDVAWYSLNSGNQTHAVAMKAANELGIYDMSGNVREWCSDWYGYGYYGTSPENNPQGPATGSYRVFRGGSWGDHPSYCRVAIRGYQSPFDVDIILGFRLVLAPQFK
jgi:formylglycine-generating enzyme required for sulfatase activity